MRLALHLRLPLLLHIKGTLLLFTREKKQPRTLLCCCCAARAIPVLVPVCIRIGRVDLRNQCRSWVHLLDEDRQSGFWERLPRNCSLILLPATSWQLGIFFGWRRWLALQPYCMASSGMATSTTTMSTSISSGAAVYISDATRPLFSVIKMMINIKSMFVTFRSHVHMSDVTNLLLVFFIYNNVRSCQNPTGCSRRYN